jgi:hypothetical protein
VRAALGVALALAAASALAADGRPLVFDGATLVDVSRFGASDADVKDAVVVLGADRVVAAGPRRSVHVPKNARIVDARGRFIVPGLVDAFATQGSQSQASAHLYMGVTSFVDASDDRRGPLFDRALPSPRILRMAQVTGMSEPEPGRRLTEPELRASLRAHAAAGVKALLLLYPMTPDQVRVAVDEAGRLELATIGELGATSYAEAISLGVRSFVHTSRYSLDLASPALHAALAAEPFGPPRTEFYHFLTAFDAGDPALTRYASVLGASGAALIPTLSLWYLDLPDSQNPWLEPVAAILDPREIHLPADRVTGKHQTAPWEVGFATNILRIETRYRAAGAHYLAGSGTDAFGTLPGISLHTELSLLVRIGLTPRQALAAATGNVAAVFGWKVGCLEAGCAADLLVLDANPAERIENLKQIRSVVRGGEILDRDALLKR